MKNLREIKPLLKLIGKEKYKIFIAACLIFLNGIASIFTGYLNGAAVEAITNLNIKKAIIFLAVYFILEVIVDGIIINNSNSMLFKIECKITERLRNTMFKKSLCLPSKAFEEHESGEIINRIANDTNTLTDSFGSIMYTVTNLISSLIIMIYIFINSWIIGVEILSLVFLLGIVINKYSPKLQKVSEENKEYQDKFTSTIGESLRGIREIKTLGIKNNLIEHTKLVIKEIFSKSSEEIIIEKRFNIITNFLKALMEVGVFITCVVLIYYNKVSLTFFIAMTYYIYRYTYLIENINELNKKYQKTIVSLKRINEILENTLYEDEYFGNKKLKNISGSIEFKDVTFAYNDGEDVLKNFNIKLEPNKKQAIIGKSGQGKSTIFNLITRIYDSNSGEILIDNINVKELDEQSLRQNIAIIRQDPFIFNKTIKENFEIVDKKITLKQIREYCKKAYIDDYIMSLPKGYNTLIGEGGVNLSGGQKQRLAIARALSKKSKIILFDEATSALDNESQKFIKKSIDDLVKDHTIVIIAHRLSTIVDSDIIYVVDNGKVKASGKHEELLENNKIYKKLYENESN